MEIVAERNSQVLWCIYCTRRFTLLLTYYCSVLVRVPAPPAVFGSRQCNLLYPQIHFMSEHRRTLSIDTQMIQYRQRSYTHLYLSLSVRLNFRGENFGSFGISVKERSSYVSTVFMLPAPPSTQLKLYASSSDFLEKSMRMSVCRNSFPLLELANLKQNR